MKKINVKPCANGKLCDASYDEKDGTVVIFKDCMALGYFNLNDIFEEYKDDNRRSNKRD